MEPELDEEETDDVDDASVEEWQAEAGKWKQRAVEHERAAAQNAGAAERLAQLESSLTEREKRHADKLAEAEQLAADAEKSARSEGLQTAAEWQAQAEKWKASARRFEDLAKKNLAAAARLEKLEAEGAAASAKAAKAEAANAETKADLEAKATQAEMKAMRLEVARELQVPAALIDLLSGNSKREIEQSADKLLRELAANKQPEPDTVQAEQVQQKAKEDGELAQARNLLTEAEVKALRLEVAIDKRLPSGLADMLNARTREDLERQADALLAAIGGVKSAAEQSTRSRMPVSRLRSGALPDGAHEPDADPQQVAEAIMRRSRGY